jgi:hypothetical protein
MIFQRREYSARVLAQKLLCLAYLAAQSVPSL